MIIVNEQGYLNADICCGETPVFKQSRIVSESPDNMIFCERGVTLNNSTITFVGSGNLVYLSSNYHTYNLDLRIYRDSVFFMDENNYMNGNLNILCQEHQNVLIGKEGVFSYGIHFMTADAHLIYDIKNDKRINESKSICIGDHVWLGSFASIFKGTIIGSGSIIGGTATVTGKTVPSNTIWAGNPAKKIKDSVFWQKNCPNLYDVKQTDLSMSSQKKEGIFCKDDYTLDFNEVDERLINCRDDVKSKLEIITSIRENNRKNRFFVELFE